MSKPIEYIERKTQFLGNTFYIDEGAHIPRPSTEFITRFYIDYINQLDKPNTVADIGTGTGVLAISFALKCENTQRVYAIDLYEKALRVTRKNIDEYNLNEKIITLKGDLMSPIIDKRVNVIFANLPFASDEKINNLRVSVKEHEPLTGIHGGKTGFELYDKLFLQLEDYPFFDALDALWLFCGKEHVDKVKNYHQKQFSEYKLQIFGDAVKDYYAHCLFTKAPYNPAEQIELL